MKIQPIKIAVIIFMILLTIQMIENVSLEETQEPQDFVLTQKEPCADCCAGQFVDAADPDWPFDVWINAGSYQSYSAERSDGTAMYGSFEVQSSVGIDFFICDQANYNLWTDGYTASVYELSYNVGSLDWEFIVPYDDRWYKMYDNTDNLFYQAHVVGTHRIDNTAPTITLNLDDGETYSGTQDIIVNAADEGFGVYTISLFINDVLTDSGYDNSLVYEWDTTRFDEGDYEVRVRTEDNAGNERSLTIDVTVYHAPDLMILILVVGCVAIVGIGICVSYSQKRQTPELHPETITYERQQESSPPTIKLEETGFCTSCGSPRIQPSAKYCGKCGASF